MSVPGMSRSSHLPPANLLNYQISTTAEGSYFSVKYKIKIVENKLKLTVSSAEQDCKVSIPKLTLAPLLRKHQVRVITELVEKCPAVDIIKSLIGEKLLPESYLHPLRDNDFNLIPDELALRIFRFLGRSDAAKLGRTCKRLQAIRGDLSLIPTANTLKFGAESWRRHLGEVGVEPPVSPELEGLLNSRCPFTDKPIKDLYMLVLIPSTVNGSPYSFARSTDLVQHPLAGNRTQINHEYTQPPALVPSLGSKSSYVSDQDLQKPVMSSYWVLMSRTLTSKMYIEGRRISSAEYCQRANSLGYDLPRLIEATTCVAVEYIQKGTRLYAAEAMVLHESEKSPGLLISSTFIPEKLLLEASKEGISISRAGTGQLDAHTAGYAVCKRFPQSVGE